MIHLLEYWWDKAPQCRHSNYSEFSSDCIIVYLQISKAMDDRHPPVASAGSFSVLEIPVSVITEIDNHYHFTHCEIPERLEELPQHEKAKHGINGVISSIFHGLVSGLEGGQARFLHKSESVSRFQSENEIY
ncbi:hypothetical protein SAY86_028955 [Trapa natans]|uniref:Uncharacterized protein n=1 Tax=Trapa natans TaxID=22666 RepID=A0AAN7M1G6_TRANT|nr:hypothetical protein SAY86_028955 [Trapa natans]